MSLSTATKGVLGRSLDLATKGMLITEIESSSNIPQGKKLVPVVVSFKTEIAAIPEIKPGSQLPLSTIIKS